MLAIARKLIVGLFAVVLLSFGVVATTASASFASTTGCGSTCDNRNPATYNACIPVLHYNGATCSQPENVVHCADDAKTVRTTSDGQANLRYSPLCRTAWVQIIGDAEYGDDGCIHNYNTSGTLRIAECAYGEQGIQYSLMVNTAGLNSKVCDWGTPYGSFPECEDWTSAYKG